MRSVNMHFHRRKLESRDGPPNNTERVNVIYGGQSGGGDFRSARRAYAKRDIYIVIVGERLEFPDMSFSRNDFERIAPMRIHWRRGKPNRSGQSHGRHGKASTIGHEDGGVHHRGHVRRSLQ
ncbi:hypothetical protein LIER_35343 [Lithospermum erythrorhizon]|uniref:Uncharacterized protein n=1 Tax=Lithospermum erythrorhizon TaxID=34254 RepID=A0AAV3NRP9_LITER